MNARHNRARPVWTWLIRCSLGLAGLALGLVPGVSLAEEKEGMPQLDPHSYASQLFWLAIFFIVVFVFLRFVGLPRVVAILDDRRRRITGDVGAAEQLRLQAADAQKAYETTMADAHAKARQLLARTQEQNAATLSQKTRAATAEFDQRVGEAVQRIDAARAEALNGIRAVALGLAADITFKLSGRAPGPDSLNRAIDAAGQETA